MRWTGTMLCLGVWLGACSESEAPVDGGVDAGQLDASLGDAQMTDDGGVRDATVTDSGQDADATVSDSGGGNAGTPLLERPVNTQVACSVSTPISNKAPLSWYQGGHDFAVSGTTAMLARTESNPPGPFEPAPTSIVLGPVDASGLLGPVTRIKEVSEFGASSPAIVTLGSDDWLVAWVEDVGLRTVRVQGTSVSAINEIPSAPDVYGSLPFAVGHGGAGIITSDTNFKTGSQTYSFLRLDMSGAQVGSWQRIAETSESAAPTLVATTSGWLVILRTGSGLESMRLAVDGTPDPSVVLAADGERVAGRGAGFDRARHALLPWGDGFVAAWVESKAAFDEESYSGVRLAHLNSRGELASVPIWVRAPEIDIDEVEPSLSRFGDHALLSLAHGTHIYICAGCMPDHRVDVVAFDPDTMTPVSSPVSVEAPSVGGLLRREEALVGGSLRMAFSITYHVHGDPGTAVVTCTDQ